MASRRQVVRLAIGAAALFAAGAALAQSPFGIGTPEPAGGAAWAGPLAPFFTSIAAWQADVYQQMTGAVGSLREDGSAFWLLIGVSLLYGVFHAIGPGHGKAVVAAYLLASGDTLRRGIVISFAASFAQAVTAVVLVGILAGILSVTAASMTVATDALEIGSYVLIALVGAWLLWSRLRGGHGHAHAHAATGPAPARDHDHHGHNHGHHDHAGPEHAGHGQHGDHDHDEHCRHAHPAAHAVHHDHEGHDHLHAPDPRLLRRPLTLASAWTAIIAVGIRPCSGAIIVLVFALSQGLFAAGIVSAFVMALGTGAAVAVLAALAVLARDFAQRLTGTGSRVAAIAFRTVEIGGALAVLLLGLILLGGALSG